jgi:hypothetical protein
VSRILSVFLMPETLIPQTSPGDVIGLTRNLMDVTI